jgi:hypothetical protein
MAYGKIKADTLVYDNSGSDTEVTIASLGNKVDAANPTFTGTVTIPTPAANDNTTKAASTAYVQTELGDYAALAGATFTGNVVMSGNLTVQGTTTTISSTTIDVADKNLELGKVSTPTDTTADGGGITLKGATDKTFNWVDATDAWTSSEHIHLPDSKYLKLGTNLDLQLFHDSGNSWLKESGTGILFVDTDGSEVRLSSDANTKIMASFVKDGACQLRHNNNLKFATSATGVTVTGTVTDTKGELRKIPLQDESSGAYTLVASDAGQAVHCHSSTTAVTVNQSVFAAGDAVTIVNGGSSDLTITQGSSFTLRNSADASTGNRTLAQFGMATLWFSAHNTAYISGAGLS